MNSFSTLGSLILRGKNTSSVNSFSYINGFAKNPTVDFSGSSFIDLSAASSYAPTACGLNIGNENSTFARLKYNGNYLKTSDFNTESEAFTFHLKHASRYSTLPPFNFQYPNVTQLSNTTVRVGSSFTATFFSFLNPGTIVPYLITGCTSANLSNASLTGSFTSPYTVIQFTVTGGTVGNSISFLISGIVTSQIVIAAPFDSTNSLLWIDATDSTLSDSTVLTTTNFTTNKVTYPTLTIASCTGVTFKSAGLKTGYPGFYFGGNTGIVYNLPAGSINVMFTGFVVVKVDSGALTTLIERTTGNAGACFDIYQMQRYVAGTGAKISDINLNNINVPSIFAFSFSVSGGILTYKETLYSPTNGYQTYSYTSAGAINNDTSTTLRIGSRSDGVCTLTGTISEVIAFDTALSDTRQSDIIAYLKNKWAILPLQVTYTVTVVGGEYWISTNGATAVRKPHLTLASGTTYTFDQSHASNVGYPLQLTLHTGFPTTYAAYNNTSTAYTTGVVTTGTSVTITVDSNTQQPLYYYCTNVGNISMGYIPPLAIIKYTFEIENGTVVANSGTAGTSGNGTIAYINTTSGSTVAGTQTISYDSATFKIGSKSLYNNIYSGASSYVQLPSVSFGSSKMTYCCWMKLINIPASTQIVPLSFESTAAIQNNIRPMDILVMKYTGTNHVFMNFQNQANYNYFDKTSTADFNNTWKHITITVDTTNNVTCMYTDGVKNTSLITPTQTSFPFNTSPYNQVGTFWKQIIGSPFPTNTAGFRIMCAGGNNSSYTSMNGYIDDYRIYNTILTDAEILSIYQNTNYNF